MSSSGLVFPPDSPMRDGKVTGSENAPVPAFASPLPAITEPCQSTVTLRSKVAMSPPVNARPQGWATTLFRRLCSLRGDCQLHTCADEPERHPHKGDPPLTRRGTDWIED